MRQLTIAAVAACALQSIAQQSFESYKRDQEAHRLSSVEQSFLVDCGIPLTGTAHVFAINKTAADPPGRWEQRTSLIRSFNDQETDYFDTADVTLVKGQPRAMNLWFLVMDIGWSSNALICLDESGKIRLSRAVTRQEDVAGNKPTWSFVEIRHFDQDGKMLSKQSYFADANGHRVAKPKLNAEERVDGWNPDHSLVTEVLRPLGLTVGKKGR